MISVLLAVVAAVLLALACAVEQDSAGRVPEEQALKLSLLTRLLRTPRWLVGIGLAAVSFPIQATALGMGSLVVVEPILASGIALALPMQWVIWRRHLRPIDLLLVAVVAAALAMFLTAGQLGGGTRDGEPVEWLMAGAVSALVAAALAVAALPRKGAVRAGLLGTAAGTLFGVQSALLKATVDGLSRGVLNVVTDWHLYALLVTGVTALVLEQSAYQTGALAPSVTATKLVAAVTAVALGLLLFDERVTSTGIRLVMAIVALVVALVALTALSWSQASADLVHADITPGGGHAG